MSDEKTRGSRWLIMLSMRFMIIISMVCANLFIKYFINIIKFYHHSTIQDLFWWRCCRTPRNWSCRGFRCRSWCRRCASSRSTRRRWGSRPTHGRFAWSCRSQRIRFQACPRCWRPWWFPRETWCRRPWSRRFRGTRRTWWVGSLPSVRWSFRKQSRFCLSSRVRRESFRFQLGRWILLRLRRRGRRWLWAIGSRFHWDDLSSLSLLRL